MSICLLPMPKKMTEKEGFFLMPAGGYCSLDSRDLYPVFKFLKEECAYPAVIGKKRDEEPSVTFEKDASLDKEGYGLSVTKDGIHITYSTNQGAFYAICTLKQLIMAYGAKIPCVEIDDSPAFENRGYLLDIRSKIPTLETLKKIIDRIAFLKINQFHIYIEGFAFSYESFPQVLAGLTPLTGEEVMELDAYAKERFVMLVPTHNNFGHMNAWLEREEFRSFSECPDGFTFDGCFLPNPRCLNPLDERSYELIRQMSADFLPYFSSPLYNACCDETLELGQGHAKEACEKYGKEKVYLDFLMKVYSIAKEHNKTMMFWADIISHGDPEVIKQIPEDMIALHWGYLDSQPGEDECKLFYENGVKYYICPGTAAWNALIGKTNQMLANIRNAAKRGLQYGAIGFLNTDWGDEGTWQGLSTGYAGVAFGAAMGWQPDANDNIDLARALDLYIFKDKAGKMGQFVLELGNYYLHEGRVVNNVTSTVQIFYVPDTCHTLVQDMKTTDFDRTESYILEKLPLLYEARMECEDADAIIKEYLYGIEMIRFGLAIGRWHLQCLAGTDTEDMKKNLRAMRDVLIGKFKEVWLLRNKEGGMEASYALMAKPFA